MAGPGRLARRTAKGARPADPGWTEQRLRDLERLKCLLWHGPARQATGAAQELADDAWGRDEDAKEDGTETAEARGKLGRLRTAAEELATCLRRNAGQIVNHGERISTGFVESAVVQVVPGRFSKKRSMRGPRLARASRCRPGRARPAASWKMPSGADGRGSSRRPRPNRTRQGTARSLDQPDTPVASVS